MRPGRSRQLGRGAALATGFGERGAAVKTIPPWLLTQGQRTPRVHVVDLRIPIQGKGLTLSLEDKKAERHGAEVGVGFVPA